MLKGVAPTASGSREATTSSPEKGDRPVTVELGKPSDQATPKPAGGAKETVRKMPVNKAILRGLVQREGTGQTAQAKSTPKPGAVCEGSSQFFPREEEFIEMGDLAPPGGAAGAAEHQGDMRDNPLYDDPAARDSGEDQAEDLGQQQAPQPFLDPAGVPEQQGYADHDQPLRFGQREIQEASPRGGVQGSRDIAGSQDGEALPRALAADASGIHPPLPPPSADTPAQPPGDVARLNTDDVIAAERRSMFGSAGVTARNQGLKAYGLSFGVWGVASRAIGLGVGAATTNPWINGAVNTAAPLTMAMFHGAAGNAAKPGDEGTKFIPTPGTALPKNAPGNAFRPFMGGLAVGNTAVSALVDGGTALTTLANGGNGPTPVVNTAIQGTLKNALFAIPGAVSGIHTARNVFATQAKAGMSLQEPIKDAAGEQAGVIITHQSPIGPEGGRQEIGQIRIDKGGEPLQIAVNRGSNEVATRMQPKGIQPPTSHGQGIRDYFAGAVPRESSSATKIVALGSTLAGNAAMAHYVSPLLRSALEARGLDPAVAGPVATIVMTAASSALLGGDFIPKFMTFGYEPTTRAGALLKGVQASLPGLGGPLALLSRQAKPDAAPRLNESQFEQLAQNKAGMLGALAQLGPPGRGPMVVRADDATLQIDVDQMRMFIQDLALPPDTPESRQGNA